MNQNVDPYQHITVPEGHHRHAYDDDGMHEPCPVDTCPWNG